MNPKKMKKVVNQATARVWYDDLHKMFPPVTRQQPAQGHTPGPWHTKDRSGALEVQDKENLPIAEIFGNGYTEAQANARLIAAAPDLLAALKRCVDEVDGTSARLQGRYKQARAAIAKAEGH